MERVPPELRKDIVDKYRQLLEEKRRERILSVIEKIPQDGWDSALSRMIEDNVPKVVEIAVSKDIPQKVILKAWTYAGKFDRGGISNILFKKSVKVKKDVEMSTMFEDIMNIFMSGTYSPADGMTICKNLLQRSLPGNSSAMNLLDQLAKF